MRKPKFNSIIKLVFALIAAAFMVAGCQGGATDNSPEDKPSGVTSVTLDRNTSNILIGAEVHLTATVKASDGVDTSVLWTSSDTSVATVSQDGVVTGVKAGTVNITATAKADSSKKDVCAVTVGEAVDSGTTEWNFVTQPSNIGTDEAAYNDVEIAATSSGSASLTVTASALKWATSYLQTGKNTATYTEYASKSKATYTLTITSTSTVTIEMAGSGGTDETYRWMVVTNSSGNIVEKIESSVSGTKQTLSLESIAAGAYTIYTNGVRIYSIKVEGESSGETLVYPMGLTLDQTSLSLDVSDDSTTTTAQLVATITNAAEVTAGRDGIEWTSSDTSVATVSSAGLVTAVKAGTAVITAATEYGDGEATCIVTVTGSPTKRTITLADSPVGYASLGTSYATSGAQTVVSTRSELVNALINGGIIIIDGMIDMSEGKLWESGKTSLSTAPTALDSFVHSTVSTYSDYADWVDKYTAACSDTTEDGDSESTTKSSLYDDLWKLNKAYGNLIQLTISKDGTTLIGKDENAGIRGGSIQISGKKNIIIRNLTIQDPCDPFPHHESEDGYNAQWDGINIQESSSNIWIDHCTFEDTLTLAKTTNTTKEKWQIFDGLCDMKRSSTNITVSNCHFKNHDKTMLIGSSDSDGDNSKRFVSLIGNYFENCGQRLPMVRNSTIHVLNNYYTTSGSPYSSQSCVNARKNAIVYAENNYFGSGCKYSFNAASGDTTPVLHASGNAGEKASSTSNISATDSTLFSSLNIYTYTAVTAAEAKTNAEENAGAGCILK